jgi:hypothetical protein
MPLIWSSVPPLLPPLTAAVAGVCGGQCLATANQVCPRCVATLSRGFSGGQGLTGVHKALASVENRGKFGCSRACCGVLSTPSLAPQLPPATCAPFASPVSGTLWLTRCSCAGGVTTCVCVQGDGVHENTYIVCISHPTCTLATPSHARQDRLQHTVVTPSPRLPALFSRAHRPAPGTPP